MLHIAITDKKPSHKIIDLAKTNDLFAVNKHGNTPLHHALIHCKKITVIKALISPDVLLVKNNAGNTPLHTAVLNNCNLAIVKAVFHPNADRRNNAKKTPLHFVDDKDVGVFLIENGFDLLDTDKSGNIPLHYAKNDEVVSILLNEQTAGVKNKLGFFPINTTTGSAQYAIAKCSSDEAKNTRYTDGYTPLEQACTGTFDFPLDPFITKENTSSGSSAMLGLLRNQKSENTILQIYNEEIHRNKKNLLINAIMFGHQKSVIKLFISPKTIENSIALKTAIEYSRPFSILKLLFNETTKGMENVAELAMCKQYSDEAVSTFLNYGKIPITHLETMLTDFRYTLATIDKAFSGQKVPITNPVAMAATAAIRGVDIICKYITAKAKMTSWHERCLLARGISQEVIDGLFTKANTIESKECFCCLVDFEEDPLDVLELSCDHRIHRSCSENFPDDTVRCVCGSFHSID